MVATILQTIVLWLIGGITPGPIILLCTSKILSDKSFSIYRWLGYGLLAGFIEFIIGFFVVGTANMFQIPLMIFSILGIFGGIFLVYIAYTLYWSMSYQKWPSIQLDAKYVITYMLLNGPMRLFRVTVCLPIAMQLKQQLMYGEFIFVAIFEIAMILWLSAIIWSIYLGKKFFLKNWREVMLGKVLSVLLLGLWVKLIIDSITFIF